VKPSGRTEVYQESGHLSWNSCGNADSQSSLHLRSIIHDVSSEVLRPLGPITLMSFLYRHGLLISRKKPYLDWANNIDNDGASLSVEVSGANRSLYLVPEVAGQPDLSDLVEEFWIRIFEEELGAWMIDRQTWPNPRTREMFDEWFDVELNESVFDLTPDEPLTQADVDADDLAELMGRCAACGLDVDADEGQVVGFKLNNRDLYAPFEGRAMSLPLGGDDDSDAVRVCSSTCEKVMRNVVPDALRRLTGRIRPSGGSGVP
jgi:hypothetical protein